MAECKERDGDAELQNALLCLRGGKIQNRCMYGGKRVTACPVKFNDRKVHGKVTL